MITQTALIKEVLRITAVATSRFPVQLYEPLKYNGYSIPAMVSKIPRKKLTLTSNNLSLNALADTHLSDTSFDPA
jgi:hypothetical protein